MPELVEISIEDDRWSALGIETLAGAAAQAALLAAAIPVQSVEISVLACNDQRISELNAAFRAQQNATNVLSWPTHDLASAAPGAPPAPPPGLGDGGPPIMLGDIAISYEICRREARQSGLSLEDHASHLIVHGCLHLLGYDHVNDADATVMETLEAKALASMGISNPYR